MNCFHLLIVFSHLLLYRLSTGDTSDWQAEIKQINSKLSDISNKLVSVDRMSNQIDFLKLALDLINSKLDNNKRRLEETESNVKRITEICFGRNREVEMINKDRSLENTKMMESNLASKIDHYGNKMLREQQTVKNSTAQQTVIIYDLRNITISGLNKMLTKFEKFSTSLNQIENSFSGISTRTRDLLSKSVENEVKLIELEDRLNDAESWFKTLEEKSKIRSIQLWSNISSMLDSKGVNLSPKAMLRLNRAINQSKEIVDVITEIKGLLEPKLIHVSRLSEMLNKNLKENRTDSVTSIANNLTVALSTLKDTTPSMMLSLSVNANSLTDALLNLKSLENNRSECEADAIDEIRKHHIEMKTYLSNTKHDIKEKDENAAKIWNEVMDKLQNIPQKISGSDDIVEKLKLIREEIKECRNILNTISDSDSEENFDTTFG